MKKSMINYRAGILLTLSIFLFSCSEEFSIKPSESEEKISFEGAITNENGPYFFKLIKSNLFIKENANYEGIPNAIIIVSDNLGNIDTCKLLNDSIYQHPKYYYYFTIFENYKGNYDTLRLNDSDKKKIEGVYYTTKIKGQPKTKYHLQIIYGNKHYEAFEEMLEVPDIDSVKFSKNYLGKGEKDFYAPLIYFKEPKPEKNYYMFNFGSDKVVNIINSSSQIWNFSILEDKLLPEYVQGLTLDDGASPTGMEDFFYFNLGDSATIRILSLTKSSYEYYSSLLNQFKNDGGAYSPTPASPISNISNGALGYFRVSAVSEKKELVKE